MVHEIPFLSAYSLALLGEVRRAESGLEALLQSDEDMAALYLTHRAAKGSGRAIDQHAEERRSVIGSLQPLLLQCAHSVHPPCACARNHVYIYVTCLTIRLPVQSSADAYCGGHFYLGGTHARGIRNPTKIPGRSDQKTAGFSPRTSGYTLRGPWEGECFCWGCDPVTSRSIKEV